MTVHAEHAQGPSMIEVIEMVGVSREGWEDAVRQLVSRASQSIRHITGLDVNRNTAVIRAGKITDYHVTVKLAFVVEPAAIDQ